jgi:hypothetical protein
MLEKQPDERFLSAESLLQELRDLEKRGEADSAFALPTGAPTTAESPTTANLTRSAETRWPEWSSWLRPSVHPWLAFVIWGALLVTIAGAAGRRSARRPSATSSTAGGQLAHVARESTAAKQLELARRENTDDAWWGLLLYFPGAPENHVARQELIPRLFQQQRFAEAEELCLDILAAKNAPQSAKATAWAGRALNLALTGHHADAEQIDRQHLRDLGNVIQRPLGEWLNEALRRLPRPSGSNPFGGPRPRGKSL